MRCRYTHRKLSAVPYVLVLATPSFVSGGASPPGGLTGAIVAAFDGRDQTVSGATTYVRLQQHAVCSDLSADTVVGNAALTATTSSSCGRAASTSPTTTATSTTTTMASTSTTVPTTVTIGTTTTPGTTPVTLQARQTVYVTDTWAPNANATASGLGMPTLYTILALSTPTGVLRTTPQDTVNPVGVPDITCQSVYNNWTLAVGQVIYVCTSSIHSTNAHFGTFVWRFKYRQLMLTNPLLILYIRLVVALAVIIFGGRHTCLGTSCDLGAAKTYVAHIMLVISLSMIDSCVVKSCFDVHDEPRMSS